MFAFRCIPLIIGFLLITVHGAPQSLFRRGSTVSSLLQVNPKVFSEYRITLPNGITATKLETGNDYRLTGGSYIPRDGRILCEIPEGGYQASNLRVRWSKNFMKSKEAVTQAAVEEVMKLTASGQAVSLGMLQNPKAVGFPSKSPIPVIIYLASTAHTPAIFTETKITLPAGITINKHATLESGAAGGRRLSTARLIYGLTGGTYEPESTKLPIPKGGYAASALLIRACSVSPDLANEAAEIAAKEIMELQTSRRLVTFGMLQNPTAVGFSINEPIPVIIYLAQPPPSP
ncbi:hypothetical protein BT96DRAFT_915964 [Gymnopus androsaceus JB14]|uniref:Uncharacterized protein n=1 Tax=Gymnopus androsaceus JB14 TaxID=1447944 RepID=A0A6A4I1W4_9AGAR|nr:hypothetical protein BT96DRAFT_915964 [Gymnopus androsaceus JB14]